MNIVFAKTTAIVGDIAVVADTHWPADDPIVKAYPSLFTDDLSHGLCFSVPPAPAVKAAPPVETATAAPGEKRPRRAE